MREEIAIVAGPKEWGCTRESWLNRVTKEVEGVSFRTVKGLWYNEKPNPNQLAVIAIKRRAAEITATKEALAAADQFSTIAAGLRAIDPEFHSGKITEYLNMARELRDYANGR